METKSKLSKFFMENADSTINPLTLKLFYHVENIMHTCDMYEHLKQKKVFDPYSCHMAFLGNHIARSLSCVRNDGFTLGEDLPVSHNRSQLLEYLGNARMKYVEYLEKVERYEEIHSNYFLQLNLNILGVVAIIHCCKYVIDDASSEDEGEETGHAKSLSVPLQSKTTLGLLLDYCRFLILHSGISPRDLSKIIKTDIESKIAEYIKQYSKHGESKDVSQTTIKILQAELSRSNKELMNPTALFESLLLCYEAGALGKEDKDTFKILVSLLDNLYGRTSRPISLIKKPFMTKQGLKYLFDYMGKEKMRSKIVFDGIESKSCYIDYMQEYILYDINERVWSIASAYKDYWRFSKSRDNFSSQEKLKFLNHGELKFVKEVLEDLKNCLHSLLPERHRHKVDAELSKKIQLAREIQKSGRHCYPERRKPDKFSDQDSLDPYRCDVHKTKSFTMDSS